MPILQLTTTIRGPIAACYAAARDLSLRRRCDEQTRAHMDERAARGELNEWDLAIWRSPRFAVWRRLLTDITRESPPTGFKEFMARSLLGSFSHDHFFAEVEGGTEMSDFIEWDVPIGPDGDIMPRNFAGDYLRDLIYHRNLAIKRVGEGDDWWARFSRDDDEEEAVSSSGASAVLAADAATAQSELRKARAMQQEVTAASMYALAQALELESHAQSARERDNPRGIRPPVTARPSDPMCWQLPFSFDFALPAAERDPLVAFCQRFTTVYERAYGVFVVGPDTEPESRRAAWDNSCLVLELEQLRALLPPDDHAARLERLVRVLATPTGDAWSELVMLLSTWDEATLPVAIAEAEGQLVRWPDELRTGVSAWALRPALRALVRSQCGKLHGDEDMDHITTVQTQDVDLLEVKQQRLAHVSSLELSGRPGLLRIVLRCTALARLERLVLIQPTYEYKTAPIDLGKLLRAPHLQGLKGLGLHGYTLSDEDLEALAECPQPLEHLQLQHAGMQPSAGRALARLVARKRLRTLDLKYNDLGPEGAHELFAHVDDWRSLRALDISANEIGDEGAVALAAASLDELRRLNLSWHVKQGQLGPAAARALAEARSLGRLETLFLGGHPIGSEGVAAILHSSQLRALRELDASYFNGSLAELALRSGAAPPVTLTALRLNGHMSPYPPMPLDLSRAEFLRTVRTLNLDLLESDDYATVMACPYLGSLEILGLGGRKEDALAFKALVSTPPPPRLRYLELCGWQPTAEQAAEFAASPLGRQLWGIELMTSRTVPDAWYALYRGGLPLVNEKVFSASRPSEFTTTTTFREEV